MQKRFLVLAVLLLVLLSTSLVNPKPAKCADDRCKVAKSVCAGQADLLNELCKAMGGSVSQCLDDFIEYYQSCMASNGC